LAGVTPSRDDDDDAESGSGDAEKSRFARYSFNDPVACVSGVRPPLSGRAVVRGGRLGI